MNVEGVIEEDWASDPGVMEACLHIWHALSARESQLDHYTFEDLFNFAQARDESQVTQALLYLATPKMRVLKTCLMYEFDGGYHDLPEEEVVNFSKGEIVIHPEFGEPIPESQILMCFAPGATLRNRGAE